MSIGQQLFNGPLGTTAGSDGAFIPSPQYAALGAGGWTFAHPSAGFASASLSSSIKVGGLSVPASWANGAPGAAEQAATKVVGTNMVGSPGAGAGPNERRAGRSPDGSARRATRGLH